MAVFEMRNARKAFGALEVLKGVSLKVEKGEVVSIIGPSGGGKSTMLRCATLLETMDSGTLAYGENVAAREENGKSVYAGKAALAQVRRQFGLVFQQFDLFPHYTVLKNVCDAPISVQKRDRVEVEAEAMALLDKMGLKGKENAYPYQLSGGQQQRVAIARALVNHPKVLLLDEPLGALDLKLRKDMQIELKRIQQSLDITFIYVTHDQEEALTMSDTVVVMNRGDIQQIGSPQDIYNEPNNAFVADFIGESNILDGVMLRDFRVEFAGQEFTCVDAGFGSREIVQVVVRPEDIQVVPAIQGQLTGLVENVIFKGVHYEMHVRQAGYEWIIHSTQASQVGELIGMNIGPDEIHIMHRTQG